MIIFAQGFSALFWPILGYIIYIAFTFFGQNRVNLCVCVCVSNKPQAIAVEKEVSPLKVNTESVKVVLGKG